MNNPTSNIRSRSTSSSTSQRIADAKAAEADTKKQLTMPQRISALWDKFRAWLWSFYKANKSVIWQVALTAVFLFAAYFTLSFMFVWGDKSIKWRDREFVWADNFLARFMPKRYKGRVCEFVEGNVKGNVLEVGAGQGFTLDCLNPNVINSYSAVDPNTFSALELRRRVDKYLVRKGVLQDKILVQSAEDMSAFKDNSMDSVLMSHAMCSIPDEKLERVLAEVYRVLKPGGKLVFVEHVEDWQNMWVRRVQRLIQPVWSWVLGGCRFHNAKSFVEALELQSFEVKWWLERAPMMKWKLDLGVLTPHMFGIAHKQE